jgi:hypothetical protein
MAPKPWSAPGATTRRAPAVGVACPYARASAPAAGGGPRSGVVLRVMLRVMLHFPGPSLVNQRVPNAKRPSRPLAQVGRDESLPVRCAEGPATASAPRPVHLRPPRAARPARSGCRSDPARRTTCPTRPTLSRTRLRPARRTAHWLASGVDGMARSSGVGTELPEKRKSRRRCSPRDDVRRHRDDPCADARAPGRVDREHRDATPRARSVAASGSLVKRRFRETCAHPHRTRRRRRARSR